MSKLCKFLIVIAITIISASGTLSAAYSSALSTDLINIANMNRFNLRYEKSINKKNSFTVDLLFDNNYNSDYNAFGIFVGGSYRWYMHTLIPTIRTTGLEGFSVEPWVTLGLYHYEKAKEVYDNDISIEIGGGVAYKWVFFDAISIEPSIRLGVGITGPSFYSDGFILWPGISIGYAW